MYYRGGTKMKKLLFTLCIFFALLTSTITNAATKHSIIDLDNMGGGASVDSAINKHSIVFGSMSHQSKTFKWGNDQTTILSYIRDMYYRGGTETKKILFSICIFFVLFTSIIINADTKYSIIKLEVGDMQARASAINTDGIIVGTIGGTGKNLGAFKWEKGKPPIFLPFLSTENKEASATSINDKNEIVGYSTKVHRNLPAMWNSGNEIVELAEDKPGFANNINEKSQVVIETWDSNESYIWQDNQCVKVSGTSPPEIDHSAPNAINDNKEIVGWGLKPNARQKFAYLWKNDKLYDLNDEITNSYSGTLLKAEDINKNSQIIGSSLLTAEDKESSWLFEDGTVLDLGFSGATAINNNGQIVGSNYLYANNQLYNLEDLLTPPPYTYTNLCAKDINDSGQIVGKFDVDGKTHAFFMTPVEESSEKPLKISPPKNLRVGV
jgi:uncharacterized membrane protein